MLQHLTFSLWQQWVARSIHTPLVPPCRLCQDCFQWIISYLTVSSYFFCQSCNSSHVCIQLDLFKDVVYITTKTSYPITLSCGHTRIWNSSWMWKQISWCVALITVIVISTIIQSSLNAPLSPAGLIYLNLAVIYLFIYLLSATLTSSEKNFSIMLREDL